jgi:glycosyltransferase involved in cell wall biosynthesis
MNILFVHNNFPAQFKGLAEKLAMIPGHRVVAIGTETAQRLPGVDLRVYRMPPCDVTKTHPFARRFDLECRRATQVLYVATELLAGGFEPDLIIGHCGWGETLPMRSVFPKARIVIYCEYYYRPEGQDVHFDPEGPQFGVDGLAGLHCKNATTLLSLADADLGLSPTQWQKNTYPAEYHPKIHVVHEGVDGARLAPDAGARFVLPGGRVLHRGDEVVTFVARNLEPMRGYHVFMRALPDILAARPNAQAVVVGGDETSYGAPPENGKSWKSIHLDEIADRVDLSHVHVLPRLPYDRYVQLLQTSTAHVYLTAPFVLSWSMIEAMAIGCVIVGSDTAPVREALTHGVNGLLTPFHDQKALAGHVCRVLADRAAYAELGAAARETALRRYAQSDRLREVFSLLGLEFGGDETTAPSGAPAAVPPREAGPAPVVIRRSKGAALKNNDLEDVE